MDISRLKAATKDFDICQKAIFSLLMMERFANMNISLSKLSIINQYTTYFRKNSSSRFI